MGYHRNVTFTPNWINSEQRFFNKSVGSSTWLLLWLRLGGSKLWLSQSVWSAKEGLVWSRFHAAKNLHNNQLSCRLQKNVETIIMKFVCDPMALASQSGSDFPLETDLPETLQSALSTNQAWNRAAQSWYKSLVYFFHVNFGCFVANFLHFFVYFFGPRSCNGVPKLTNIRCEAA